MNARFGDPKPFRLTTALLATGVLAAVPLEAVPLAALPLAIACGASSPGSAETEEGLAAWTYDFRIDASLSRLESEVCFTGSPPTALVAIDSSGPRYLRSADGPVGPSSEPLPRQGRVISTGHLPDDACVRYVVDLAAAARQRGGIHGAYRIGDDLIASTNVWLWAPRERALNARVSATFELPERVQVSPLWVLDSETGRYRLDERAFRFTAYAAFGRFETVTVGVPGGCLRVSVLGGGVQMGREALVRSLSGSAEAVSMMFGRFPVEDASILAVPTPFSTSSPFGIVGRGSLPTVAILVGDRAEEERLARAWVPVHEFSHLAMPFVERTDAWLSEGIATYYQEVLRGRAGLVPARQAWANLDDGFRRGASDGTGRTLADESRDMMQTAAFRRVYWAGAAIALMADVAMRTRSRGEQSLDDGLERLRDCCANEIRPMSAREAIARIDGGPSAVFREIARRQLGSSDFPDLTETYARLGLTRTDEGIELGGNREARMLRESIIAPRTDLYSIRRCAPAAEDGDAPDRG